MINSEFLKLVAICRGLSQTDLARLAGVSRQAVSLWFKPVGGFINLRGRHMVALGRALKLPVEKLAAPPILSSADREKFRALLLWDRLYPSLEEFLIALCREELRALARSAEVFGLFDSARMAGKAVWLRFDDYKRFIHPVRREQLERVWRLKTSRALN